MSYPDDGSISEEHRIAHAAKTREMLERKHREENLYAAQNHRNTIGGQHPSLYTAQEEGSTQYVSRKATPFGGNSPIPPSPLSDAEGAWKYSSEVHQNMVDMCAQLTGKVPPYPVSAVRDEKVTGTFEIVGMWSRDIKERLNHMHMMVDLIKSFTQF